MRSAKYLVMIFFLCSSAAEAKTVNAATCGRTDVGSAVNAAIDGDTVVIPAGNCSWTTNLTITDKILTIQGAGVDQTTIVDNVNKGPFPNVPQLVVWITKDGGLTRLTGITFQGGATVDGFNSGIVKFTGTSHQFRIDHCKFVPTQTSALFIYGYMWGVIDHNTFDVSANRGFGLYIFHNVWNIPGSDYGDASWADATSMGTSRAVFVEDNTFTNNQSVGPRYYANDGWSGGRVVYRFNTYINTVWANHGTESSGRWRSQRSYEVYNNTFSLVGSGPSFMGSRGGVGVAYNNTATFTGGPVNAFADLQYYRATGSFAPWGQCDGSNVWDGNQSGGYPCLDQTGRGQGGLLANHTPTPTGWPNQAIEPTYAWNNTVNGVPSKMISNVPSAIVENRDFFNAVKPGYTPYTYPHPIVSGSASPSTPTNLRIVGQ